MYVYCVHVSMYVCMHVYVYLYVCVSVCIIYIPVCTIGCAHLYTYAYECVDLNDSMGAGVKMQCLLWGQGCEEVI